MNPLEIEQAGEVAAGVNSSPVPPELMPTCPVAPPPSSI